MKHTEVGGERLVLGNRGETILRLARSYLWPTLWKLGVYRGATEFGGDWRVVLVADILK